MSDNVITRRYQVQVNHARSYGDAPDLRTHEVEVEVDLDAVVELLHRAAVRSKGGISRECSGAVRVRRLDATRVTGPAWRDRVATGGAK